MNELQGHTLLSEHLDLYHPHTDSEYRETYGLWVKVFNDGALHHFSIVNLLLTIASGVAVLVVVRIATDFYALTLHPQRSEMRRLKEERMGAWGVVLASGAVVACSRLPVNTSHGRVRRQDHQRC